MEMYILRIILPYPQLPLEIEWSIKELFALFDSLLSRTEDLRLEAKEHRFLPIR